jgi:hypothetical protein
MQKESAIISGPTDWAHMSAFPRILSRAGDGFVAMEALVTDVY